MYNASELEFALGHARFVVSIVRRQGDQNGAAENDYTILFAGPANRNLVGFSGI